MDYDDGKNARTESVAAPEENEPAVKANPIASMNISIIIPVLNDAEPLRSLLKSLRPDQRASAETAAGPDSADDLQSAFTAEIIVVDGGSQDDSLAVAQAARVRVLEHSPGRGQQLDAGAQSASGRWLWFLHADSRISPAVLAQIRQLEGSPPGWGRFDVRLAKTPLLRLTAWMMNHRSALTGICTGDQGIFVHRSLLDAVGGVPKQPLMEDIELSKRLKRLGPPMRIRTPIHASPRRWEARGAGRTIMLMWWLRIRYLFGAAPRELAGCYYGGAPAPNDEQCRRHGYTVLSGGSRAGAQRLQEQSGGTDGSGC